MSTRLGGRYQLVREIGAGGMGRVFQAVDTETGRAVAAKIMIANRDDDLEALLRFQQEGAVLSTLKHPNIVEVYGTFLEEHTSCIIMELLEGRSLAQILRAEGRLPLDRVKNLTHQGASALAYAHKRAIVHRDIKPDNIMVVGDDHVKVTDFGIARILRTGATLNTATGVSIGTPLYMAPEQIEGQKVDGRADIYSFGAVMYQMVTGHPPFEGDDPLTIAFKHVHKAPASPREVNADIPNDWESLILKALAKDPGERFQTAAALQDAIGSLSGPALRPEAATGFDGHDGKRDRSADTVDRILHPEITGPGLGETRMSRGPDAYAPAPPQVPPGADAQTRYRQPEPAEVRDRGQMVPGPRAEPPRAPDMASTVLGSAGAAEAMGDTRVQARPVETPAPSRPMPAPMPVVKPVEKQEQKKKFPVIPAVIGGVLALAAIAAILFFAFGSKGSSPKAAATSTPIPPTPIGANVPSLSVAGTSNVSSGQPAILTWSSVPKAALYRVQVATAATDPSDAVVFQHPKTTQTVSSTSYTLKVVGRQYYYWRVQAEVGKKWGPYSASNHFLVPIPSIGQPVPLSPHNGTVSHATRVQLCWSPVKGAVGYRLRFNGVARDVQGTCAWVNTNPGRHHWSVAARVKGVRLYTGLFSAPARFATKKVVKATAVPVQPTAVPVQPTAVPVQPTAVPYVAPTAVPYVAPTAVPYVAPTAVPVQPTAAPVATRPLCSPGC